jgi:hypothetical protein
MFNLLKNKASVILILVITCSISLSNFSNSFTALSGAIFNAPMASANTSLTFTNKPSDTSNYSVCVYKNGTAQLAAVKAESFSISSNVSNNGDVYIAYINNSSSCFPLVNSTPTFSSQFLIVNGHQTEVSLSNYSIFNSAVASATVYNELPKLASISSLNGSVGNTSNYTICQGNTNAISVTFDDANIDELTGININDLDIQSSSFFNTAKGKLTYTLYPTIASVANNTGFDVTLTASDVFTPAPTSPASTIVVSPAVFSKNIRFSVSTNCESSFVSSSSISSSSSNSNYFYNNSNGYTYDCYGGSTKNEIFGNYFYGAIVGAVCNIYWSGWFYPNSGPTYYPPVYTSSSSIYNYNSSSVPYSSSSYESIISSSSISLIPQPISSSSILLSSSLTTQPTSSSLITPISPAYSFVSNCPVSVNDSRNYYGGGRISLQNNSEFTLGNLSANINLPIGVTVESLEKGYNFNQNGNNLNISLPDLPPGSEIATLYTTNYTGIQYNSSAVINCNQVETPRLYSGYVPPATVASSSLVFSSLSAASSRDQGTLGVRSSMVSKPICGDEVFEKKDSCICPLPKQVFATSAEVDSYNICKLAEAQSTSSASSEAAVQISSLTSTSSSSVQSSNPKPISIAVSQSIYCESPNLILSADQKNCICPTAGDLIYVEKIVDAKNQYVCKSKALAVLLIPNLSSAVSVSSSLTSSSQLALVCDILPLVLSQDRTTCICPYLDEQIDVTLAANGVEKTTCKKPISATVSIDVFSSSSSSLSSISSSIVAAPAFPASTGGVVIIGGIGLGLESVSSVSQNNLNIVQPVQDLRQSGQLSARNVPDNCDNSTKVSGICPTTGTLDARQTVKSPTASDTLSINDPYSCGGNLKGKVTDSSSKTVKYEFYNNGSTSPSYAFDVPVKIDGSFELIVDYDKIQEGTYKIVVSAKNEAGTSVSNSIEEFITKNCSGVAALNYYANKTVRTGGQNLIPILTILVGLFTLIGVSKSISSFRKA